MVALSWSPAVTSGADKNPRTLATPPIKKDGEDSSAAVENKQAKHERLVFAELKSAYTKAIPTATAIHKPVVETMGASAASYTPIFEFGKGSEHIATIISASNPSGIATANGLTETKKQENSGDKKEKQRVAISAHKSLADVRLEELENADFDIRSILGNKA